VRALSDNALGLNGRYRRSRKTARPLANVVCQLRGLPDDGRAPPFRALSLLRANLFIRTPRYFHRLASCVLRWPNVDELGFLYLTFNRSVPLKTGPEETEQHLRLHRTDTPCVARRRSRERLHKRLMAIAPAPRRRTEPGSGIAEIVEFPIPSLN